MDIIARMSIILNPLDELHPIPASDVKNRGWRGVTRTLAAQGAVVVTNHDEPEAVILPVTQYERLLEMAGQTHARAASELEALRRRFDDRLAALRAPAAGDRLRSVARSRAKLRGKVKAGAGH